MKTRHQTRKVRDLEIRKALEKMNPENFTGPELFEALGDGCKDNALVMLKKFTEHFIVEQIEGARPKRFKLRSDWKDRYAEYIHDRDKKFRDTWFSKRQQEETVDPGMPITRSAVVHMHVLHNIWSPA